MRISVFQSLVDSEGGLNGSAVLPRTRSDANSIDAKRSQALTLEEADTAPDLEFNEIIWKSIRGADSPLPPRRVAAFVLERKEKDED